MSRRRRPAPPDGPDLFGLRVGSLFSGFGGIDLAVRSVLGGDVVWHSDIKPAAVRLLAQRFPGTPNLGDLTAVDFHEVTPVDVLTFGWPCQPHSSAGKRLGADDPRALWPVIARGVEACRPAVLVGENVANVCTNGELRRVVESLADLGYVVAWRVATASDLVDAPHRRARLVLVAVDPTADPDRLDAVAAAPGVGRDEGGSGAAGEQRRSHVAVSGGASAGVTLLPTPRPQTNGGGALPDRTYLDRAARNDAVGGPNLVTAVIAEQERVTLLPTPTQSMTTGPGSSGRDGGLNLQTAATLLPTRTRQDGESARNATANRRAPKPTTSTTGWTLSDVAYANRWGRYAAAVARWETVLDRPAPAPTQPSETWRREIARRRAGQDRRPVGHRGSVAMRSQLSPRFVEWMMGVPSGHVTDAVDLSPRGTPAGERNAMLSLLGDGVVVPFIAAQVRDLLPLVLAEARELAAA